MGKRIGKTALGTFDRYFDIQQTIRAHIKKIAEDSREMRRKEGKSVDLTLEQEIARRLTLQLIETLPPDKRGDYVMDSVERVTVHEKNFYATDIHLNSEPSKLMRSTDFYDKDRNKRKQINLVDYIDCTQMSNWLRGTDVPVAIFVAFCHHYGISLEKFLKDVYTDLGLLWISPDDQKELLNKECEEQENETPKKKGKSTRKPIDWITLDELVSSQKEKDFKDLWIVLETLNTEEELIIKYYDVFLNNFQNKGVKYTYFLYDLPDNRRREARLKAMFSQYIDQIEVYYLSDNPIDEDNFFLIPFLGYSIYDPDNPEKRQGYVGFWFDDMEEFGGFRINDNWLPNITVRLAEIKEMQGRKSQK